MKRACAMGLVTAVALAWQANPALADGAKPADKPWRIAGQLDVPKWLDLGASQRTRYEHLVNQFRAGSTGDAGALVMRTRMWLEATTSRLFGKLELQDSRAFASDETPLNTGIVNAASILQAHVGLRLRHLVSPGDTAKLKLGRMTIDMGSRRFVARNGYRNTTNGFTGVDATWTSASKHTVRGFAVLPVSRLPSTADEIRDNNIEIDEENTDTLFWAMFYRSPASLHGASLEAFAYGLHERDGVVGTSRNRQLYTPGVRLLRKPKPGTVDAHVEAAVQLGSTRASSAGGDTTDLDHLAFFVHSEVGITLRTPWKPRVAVQHDFASGDADANDDKSGRFDTLFGGRRFDLGPTGIYGPFARSNINSPGLRVQVEPHPRISGFAVYRMYWLASATDSWTTSGVRDANGNSGKFLGHHAELRVRWNIVPKNLRIEVGAAHFIRGRFATDAPDTRNEPATLLYTQLIVWL